MCVCSRGRVWLSPGSSPDSSPAPIAIRSQGAACRPSPLPLAPAPLPTKCPCPAPPRTHPSSHPPSLPRASLPLQARLESRLRPFLDGINAHRATEAAAGAGAAGGGGGGGGGSGVDLLGRYLAWAAAHPEGSLTRLLRLDGNKDGERPGHR